jgi:hypothetical protein
MGARVATSGGIRQEDLGMFGSARKMAVKLAVQKLQPMVATYRHLRGLPPGFWSDEYVIGFIGTLIIYLTRKAAPKLSEVDLYGYARH